MSKVYKVEIIKKKIGRIIQNKRHGVLTAGVMLLHCNVHSHTAAYTRALMEYLNQKLSNHLSYSADLIPNDYRLFSYRKKWLR
jgi:hypothetical protein